ncbi:hypothetical protein A3Q56_07887, partial [Intoshia linei]
CNTIIHCIYCSYTDSKLQCTRCNKYYTPYVGKLNVGICKETYGRNRVYCKACNKLTYYTGLSICVIFTESFDYGDIYCGTQNSFCYRHLKFLKVLSCALVPVIFLYL